MATQEFTKLLPLAEAASWRAPYNYINVEVLSPADAGTKLDLTGELAHPEDFHGSLHVDHVVRLHRTFSHLIGTHEEKDTWKPDTLAGMGIFVYEQHSDEAKKIAEKINALALRFIQTPSLYDDAVATSEYYDLAKAGYDFMRLNRSSLFGLQGDESGYAVSLERGGLVSTRLGLGLEPDAIIDREIRVVTKRTHLKSEPEEHLAVAVSWREDDIAKIKGERVQLFDFVNPASGASVAAFVLAAEYRAGVRPRSMELSSIAATRKGMLFNKKALELRNIMPTFEALFDSTTMNESYYLMDRPVGDAGHALRHRLPKWYKP